MPSTESSGSSGSSGERCPGCEVEKGAMNSPDWQAHLELCCAGQQVPASSLWSCLQLHLPARVGARTVWVTVVLVAALYLGASQSQDECSGPRAALVWTRSGQLCGRAVRTASRDYLAFQGIPYARPPLGSLRFKDPQPAERWTGVRRALRPGPSCLQSGQTAITDSLSPTLRQALLLVRALGGFLTHLATSQSQSEDCLYLNVYTRQVSSPLSPVLVWFHGGGFHMGSGGTDLYGPDFLLEQDVVLVTLNYRLGPLGFLSVPAAGVPGNAGLKDQSLALRWVRDNIAAFGGDPNSVTIFGESAGGTSVQMHMLSPLSRGLFHRAISQSGSALNPRSTTSDGRQRALRLARLVGVEPRDDLELVARLQQVPGSLLTARSESVLTPEERSLGLAVHPFVPSIELPAPGAFLPAAPQQLLAAGHSVPVPYITGINSLEAGFMFNRPKDVFSALQDKEVEKLVPSDLGLQQGSPESLAMVKQMKRAYFGENASPGELELALIYSDLFVSWVVHRTVNMLSRQDTPPLYVYYFSYDGGLGLSHRIFDRRLPGVYHIDEIGYLFTQDVIPSGRESDQDHVVRKRMVQLWTNFAKTGNPTSGRSSLLRTEWLPANNRSRLYLEIGTDLTMQRGPLSPFMDFWDRVYPREHGGL